MTGDLLGVLRDEVDVPATELHTDSNAAYRRIVAGFASHSTFDHKAREHIRGGVMTNHAEGFVSG